MLAALAVSCGGSTPSAPSPSPSGASAVAAPFVSAHFVFFYTTLDSANIEVIARAAEAEYSRVLGDLGVDLLPAIQVHFYTDHHALEVAVAPVVGSIPSWAIAAFIVSKGGQAALTGLIRNNGDVAATFGIAQNAFEREWYDFVRARYGI